MRQQKREKAEVKLPPFTSLCTGCSGCANACPSNAIEMVLTLEGFYAPHVDTKRCVSCGSCQRYCPMENIPDANNRHAEQVKPFAAWVTDNKVRRASSSGGIFTAIARLVLEEGGAVFGVTWEKGYTVRHVLTETENQLGLLRGSKYLQSNVGFTYRQVMQALQEKRGPILFTGLPCQVAALRRFVGSGSDRLLLIDFACHGTPSLRVFHKYLVHVANGREVTGVNFRDKRMGWSRFSMAISFSDNTEYVHTFREDPFMIGFLGNLYSNHPCYDCPFCQLPRQGDLTLADYWGAPRQFKSDLGVSLILSNNTKGDLWLQRLTESAVMEAYPTPLEDTLRGNPRLVDGHRKLPTDREAFFIDLNNMQFKELSEKYIQSCHPSTSTPSPVLSLQSAHI